MLFEGSFGYWLRLKRKSLDLTREALAARVGCSAATIRKLEAEERRPSAQIAELLAAVFGVAPHEKSSFVRFARGEGSVSLREEAATAPWKEPGAPARSNLPAAVTSLIGRRQEITGLLDYLSRPEIRLVTLVGPPGIGKTRLSLETARTAAGNFPDGAFFVPLAPIEDGALIAPAVVQSLGYFEERQRPAVDMLKDGIAGRRMLLLLDNCEHLIDQAASLVSELLQACPHLKIVATSRESLRIPGEWQYPVPPLDTAGEIAGVDTEQAGQFPAIQLFIERARAVRPGFNLDPENVQAVASICARLDGLPLAIELIASQVRLLSPQSLLERMSREFMLSADGMRVLPARQKTLRTAIAWSYDSLAPVEQRLFTCLAVFSGGFMLQAAEAMFEDMATGSPLAKIIGSLADKSLLLKRANARGELRFDMLYPLREFALEHLSRTGEESRVRDAHLEYFMRLAELAESHIRGPRQVEWIERVEEEHNNIHAALEWAVSGRKTEFALRLLAGLGWIWEVRGHYSEAYGWLDRIRLLPGLHNYDLVYSRVLNHVGRYYWTQGESERALVLLQESLAICSQAAAAGELCLAETSNWLGLVLLDFMHDSDAARLLLEQGLELYTKWNSPFGIALSTFHLGLLEGALDQNHRALPLLEQGLALFQELGDQFFISRVAVFLGHIHKNEGDYDRARSFYEKNLGLDTRLRYWNGMVEAWQLLGYLHRQMGESEEAQRCFDQCLTIAAAHGLKKTI